MGSGLRSESPSAFVSRLEEFGTAWNYERDLHVALGYGRQVMMQPAGYDCRCTDAAGNKLSLGFPTRPIIDALPHWRAVGNPSSAPR